MAPTTRQTVVTLLAGALVVLTLGVLYWCYLPSFGGPFVFDDVPNLQPMNNFGAVDSKDTLARWLDTGDSGPLGRPLALLSFLIEDNSWPTSAGPFRRTNLWLHFLNAVLVGLLAHRLVRLAERAEQVSRTPNWTWAVALGATLIWTCLPIHTATVLLVVQRMTLLFSLFTLVALLCWLHGREWLARGATGRGLAWQLGGVIVGGGLGALAKETAAVLPFLLLALTLTLAPLVGPPPARRVGGAFIGLGCLAVAGAVAVHWPADRLAYLARPFDVWDRLYTEPLVLADYLRTAFVPRSVTLFHDDFPAFDPRHPSWLPTLALLTLGLALALAWQVRRTHPVLAFGILFFFAGHLLEAGPTPLELYFLHRNYVPLLGPVLALAWAVARGLERRPLAAAGLGAFYLGLCLLGVRSSATTWSSEAEISLQWVVGHPGSIRASSMAANYFGVRGHPDKATAYLDDFRRENPNRALAHVGAYYMHCRMGREKRADWDYLIAHLPRMEYDNTVGEALAILQQNVAEGQCRQVTNDDALHAFDVALTNPAFQRLDARSDLHYKKAQMLFLLNRPSEGLAEMDRAEKIRPNEVILRDEARLLTYYHQPAAALAKYQEALARDPRGRWQHWLGVSDAPRQTAIRKQIAELQKTLATPPATPPQAPAPTPAAPPRPARAGAAPRAAPLPPTRTTTRA